MKLFLKNLRSIQMLLCVLGIVCLSSCRENPDESTLYVNFGRSKDFSKGTVKVLRLVYGGDKLKGQSLTPGEKSGNYRLSSKVMPLDLSVFIEIDGTKWLWEKANFPKEGTHKITFSIEPDFQVMFQIFRKGEGAFEFVEQGRTKLEGPLQGAAKPTHQELVPEILSNGHHEIVLKYPGKTETLIRDSAQIFSILQISNDKKWALLSLMPANPEEAYGTNESKELYYLPKKYRVDLRNPKIQNLVGVPDFNALVAASLLDEKAGQEVFEFYLDGERCEVTLKALYKAIYETELPDEVFEK